MYSSIKDSLSEGSSTVADIDCWDNAFAHATNKSGKLNLKTGKCADSGDLEPGAELFTTTSMYDKNPV